MPTASATKTSIALATFFVDVLEQHVQGQRGQDEECRVHEVGDNADADEYRVRDDVSGCCRRAAGDVHPGVHEAFGEAAEDADQQVEDAGDSRHAHG